MQKTVYGLCFLCYYVVQKELTSNKVFKYVFFVVQKKSGISVINYIILSNII